MMRALLAVAIFLIAVSANADKRKVAADFTEQDVRTIHEFYGVRPNRLPPGLEKKIARSGKLPGGWERKLAPMPFDLEKRLSALTCTGCERGIIEGCAVIFDQHTKAVYAVVSIFGP